MNKLLYILMLVLLSSCSRNLLKTNVRNYTIEKTTFQINGKKIDFNCEVCKDSIEIDKLKNCRSVQFMLLDSLSLNQYKIFDLQKDNTQLVTSYRHLSYWVETDKGIERDNNTYVAGKIRVISSTDKMITLDLKIVVKDRISRKKYKFKGVRNFYRIKSRFEK